MLNFRMEIKGIDMNKLYDSFNRERASAMSKFQKEIHDIWNDEADSALSSTRQKYKSSLHFSQPDADTIRAVLESTDPFPLPTLLEFGMASFDIKPGLFKNWPKTSRVIPMNADKGHPFRFRTVHSSTPSGKSAKAYWIHPGLKPLMLHKTVIDKASGIADIIFTRLFSRIRA